MREDHKIAPLDESSQRQILVGWGSGVMCSAAGWLIGGVFIPYLGLFAGAAIALRGHFPGLFAEHIDAQLIAGTPYRRKESFRAWALAAIVCFLLAGGSSWIHRKMAPGLPHPIITSTLATITRNPATREYELRIRFYNPTTFDITVNETFTAFWNGSAILPIPVGRDIELARGDKIDVSLSVTLSDDNDASFLVGKGQLSVRAVAEYLDNGATTVYTLEGSAEPGRDNLNITRNDHRPK